ncbi:MAG: hypothetical protein QXM68_03725 [Candidatus Aenigmatarchaeota archaeon]|nr:hypothetical protein [Candidatus Aenigmarchaeota archaeon]
MMKRIVFLIILIVLVALVKIFFNKITGLISDVVEIFLSNSAYDDVCVYVIKSPEQIVMQRSQINMTLEIVNCGSTTLDIWQEIDVLNEDGFYIAKFNQTKYSYVNPGSRNVFIFSWIMNSPGVHFIIAKTYFADKYKQHNFSVLVTRAPETIPEKFPVNQLSGISQFSPGYKIDVEFQKNINITQDQEYVVPIKISNFGDSDLTGIYAILISKDLDARIIYPEKVDILKPGETSIFVGIIKAPLWLPEGEYKVDVKAVSNQIKFNDTINVRVNVLSLKEKAKELLNYYSDLIKKLENEINIIEKEKNVTIAKQYLDEAKKSIDDAKDYYKLGWFKECIEQIDIVKDNIEKTIIEISKAEKYSKKIQLPTVSYNYLIIFFITTALALLLFIIYKKKRKERELIPIKRWSFI